jgi:type II secretory ATPase GspE/PulE/Tfp pilus assembly ATPase PilB-like protein
VLFDALHIPKSHQEEVISRLKILGGMNIAEKRLPQDGRATVEFGDRLVDLRIATLPTSYGERVVIRSEKGPDFRQGPAPRITAGSGHHHGR